MTTGSNPGVDSRIAHHIHFPGYTLDELMGIACLILEALERARLRQTTRIVRENSKKLGQGDLMRIEAGARQEGSSRYFPGPGRLSTVPA